MRRLVCNRGEMVEVSVNDSRMVVVNYCGYSYKTTVLYYTVFGVESILESIIERIELGNVILNK